MCAHMAELPLRMASSLLAESDFFLMTARCVPFGGIFSFCAIAPYGRRSLVVPLREEIPNIKVSYNLIS